MSAARVDPLARLASGVRPDGAQAPAGKAPVESRDFEALLRQANSGEIASGRALRVGERVDGELDEKLIERLSRATDAAEASGARRVLALAGGRGLTIDVATRTIDGSTALDGAGLVGNIDAAMTLGPDGEGPAVPIRPGAALAMHPGLARTLAQAEGRAGGPATRA